MNTDMEDVAKTSIVAKRPFESDDANALRQIRNQAEKQRRDRLNGYIAELATLVPMVKNASKPLDKVSILRLAAAHLRLDKSCLNAKRFKTDVPSLPKNVAVQLEIIEKNIGGFLIAATFSGLVVFCSPCIEEFLGYQNIDVMGQYVSSFVHEKQAPYFEKKVSSVIERFNKGEAAKPSVTVKLSLRQRPLPRSNEIKFKKMKLKISVHANNIVKEEPEEKSIVKKKSASKDFGSSALVLIFVEPWKWLPKVNVDHCLEYRDTYFTIHGLKGEIIYSDQRISTITGYLPCDVIGSSAYQFIMESDVPIALFAQQAMFSSNDGVGIIVYRLKILGAKCIYLQSKGQLVFKKNSKEISHFICCNQWLSDDEGAKRLKKFHNRFAPFIKANKESSHESVPKPAPKRVHSHNRDEVQSKGQSRSQGQSHKLKQGPSNLECLPDVAQNQSMDFNMVDDDSFQNAVLEACKALISAGNDDNIFNPRQSAYESSASQFSVYPTNVDSPIEVVYDSGGCAQVGYNDGSPNKRVSLDRSRSCAPALFERNDTNLPRESVQHVLRNKILLNAKNSSNGQMDLFTAPSQPCFVTTDVFLNQPPQNIGEPVINNNCSCLHSCTSILYQKPDPRSLTDSTVSEYNDIAYPIQPQSVDYPLSTNHSGDFVSSMQGYHPSNGAIRTGFQPELLNMNRSATLLTNGCPQSVDFADDRRYSDSYNPSKRSRTDSVALSSSGDSGVFDMSNLGPMPSQDVFDRELEDFLDALPTQDAGTHQRNIPAADFTKQF